MSRLLENNSLTCVCVLGKMIIKSIAILEKSAISEKASLGFISLKNIKYIFALFKTLKKNDVILVTQISVSLQWLA